MNFFSYFLSLSVVVGVGVEPLVLAAACLSPVVIWHSLVLSSGRIAADDWMMSYVDA
jgi:hypothetical protein